MQKPMNEPIVPEAIAPELPPEPGWTPIPTFTNPHRKGRPFLSDRGDDDRVRIRFFERDADGVLMGKVWFGPGSEGAPGVVHGGATMAVLDHALGRCAWAAGHVSVTGRLTTEFKERIPIETILWFTARVEKTEGRKISVSGEIMDPEKDKVMARAEALFIVITPERFMDIAQPEGGVVDLGTQPEQ